MKYELIPIVYGRVKQSHICLTGTVINIMYFNTPNNLAGYLHYLSHNKTEYWRYFKKRMAWKSFDVMGNAFCRLCELVHNVAFHRVYCDVNKQWTQGVCDLERVNRILNSTRNMVTLFNSLLKISSHISCIYEMWIYRGIISDAIS